jgi:hypothetical protein
MEQGNLGKAEKIPRLLTMKPCNCIFVVKKQLWCQRQVHTYKMCGLIFVRRDLHKNKSHRIGSLVHGVFKSFLRFLSLQTNEAINRNNDSKMFDCFFSPFFFQQCCHVVAARGQCCAKHFSRVAFPAAQPTRSATHTCSGRERRAHAKNESCGGHNMPNAHSHV